MSTVNDLKTTINWGIMGCAGISRKNVRALTICSLSNNRIKLKAIASRSIDKSRAFITENGLNTDNVTAYGSYQEILNDPTIDAVYIPLPTALHLEWVVKTAEAKKHVLLEKPCAVTLADLKLMISACQKNGVFFMDGVMFMHHSRIQSLRTILKDPFANKVLRVNSSFSYLADEDFLSNDIRCKTDCDPLGALGDLSWYNIRLGIIAFSNGLDLQAYDTLAGDSSMVSKVLYPKKCSAICNRWNDSGVPLDVEGKIWFGGSDGDSDNTRYLRFDSSFLMPFRQSFEISVASTVAKTGGKVIKCDDFVLSATDRTGSLTITTTPSEGPFGNHACSIVSVADRLNFACCQEAEMFNTFSKYLDARKLSCSPSAIDASLSSEEYWTQICLWTQACINACYDSMKSDGAVTSISI